MKKSYAMWRPSMVVLLLVFSAFQFTAHAATVTWVGSATGTWNIGTNWSTGSKPSATDDVVFTNQTVVIDVTENIGKIQSLSLTNGADISLVPSGANRSVSLTFTGLALDVNAGCVLTLGAPSIDYRMTITFGNALTTEIGNISGTLRVLGGATEGGNFNASNGTLNFTATGVYEHNRNDGALPAAYWDISSTAIVTGMVDGQIGNTNQTFGNFVWNCPSQIVNQGFSAPAVAGTLTIVNTGTAEFRKNTSTLSVGNLIISGGIFNQRQAGVTTIAVSNNFEVSGGKLDLKSQSGLGVLNIGGDFIFSGGQITKTGGTASLNMNKAGAQLVNITSGIFVNDVDFEVVSGSTISFAAPTTKIVSDGIFTLQSGSTIEITSPEGISASGATGHVQTGTRNFFPNANYNYQASGASISGTGLPTTVNNLNVASGTSLELTQSIDVDGTFTNNGTVIFINDVAYNSSNAIAGSGNVTLKRTFSASHKWYRIGFAVSAGTVQDLVANFPIRDASFATNAQNIFRWDAATANYVACAKTQTLAGTAFDIFAFGTGLYVEITRPNADLNTGNVSQALFYNDGLASPNLSGTPAEREGWNKHQNPYQAFLDWDKVDDALVGPNFTNSGVAVQNNAGIYEYYKTGVGSARYIAPFQSFYIQTAVGGMYPSTLQYTPAMQTATPGAAVASFKTAPTNILTLAANGPDGEVKTHIAVNPAATNVYDAEYDMRWFAGAGAAFYSTDANGSKFGINQSDVLLTSVTPIAFTHPTNGAAFVISADLSQWDNNVRVYLKDKTTNKKTRLHARKSYAFANNTGFTGNRFELSFIVDANTKTSAEQEENLDLAVWFKEDVLNIYTDLDIENAQVDVYTISGQLVLSQKVESVNSAALQIAGSGLFVVRIAGENGTTTSVKVVKP